MVGFRGSRQANTPVQALFGFLTLSVAGFCHSGPTGQPASANLGIQRALGSGSFGSPLHKLLLFMGPFVTYTNQCGFPLQPQNLDF